MRWCILKLIVFRKSTSQRANSIPRAIYERRVYFALTSQKNNSAQVVEISKAKWTSILSLQVVSILRHSPTQFAANSIALGDE